MAASKVINQQSFHDGKVVLYQLENRPKKLWLCRLKVPNGTGYIYRGTGTSDFYQARKFADELLDELRIKTKLGQSITGPNLAKMVEDFETFARAKGEPTKRNLSIIAFLKTYAVPYFTKNKITDINAKEIAKFFDWRRTNAKRKAPKETTILHESSQFATFLKWCHRRGHLDREIKIERPKRDGVRRPHFDRKDWKKLLATFAPWIEEGRGISTSIFRDRKMLCHYIVIMAYTGIRVGEARGIRWSDLDTEPSDDPNNPYLIIHVKGKTGSREVVAQIPEVKQGFELLWKSRCEELGGGKPDMNEHVFCHVDGRPVHSMKKGFATVTQKAGVEVDRNGEKRTIYSLRHTYATNQLQEGVNHYTLARNMGTSVRMLEQFYGHTSNRAMASELTKSRVQDKKRLPWE